jgi:hypothetical protein
MQPASGLATMTKRRNVSRARAPTELRGQHRRGDEIEDAIAKFEQQLRDHWG